MIEDAVPAPPGELIRAAWRRWRAPALAVALILTAGAVVALLRPASQPTAPLDPRDTGPAGAHALAALLRQRGQSVIRVESAAAAAAAARAPGATIVVAIPALSRAGQAALAGSSANLILIAPGRRSLAALAPRVLAAGSAPVRSRAADCALPAATLAGSARMGGTLLRADGPGVERCYTAHATPAPAAAGGAGGSGSGGPATRPAPASLVRYRSGDRAITVLGTGAPFMNEVLDADGDAALAMNLLNSGRRVVWLVPGPPTAPGGQRPAASLIPPAVDLLGWQLIAAVLLAALWRARRFGPLIAEPLPVVVRASETVRGHGRLYRARRARSRAAAVLREAALSRIAARTGLPPGLAPAAVCQDLAARTGGDPAAIENLLFGPPPAADAALVALAAALDTLEGQVLTP